MVGGGIFSLPQNMAQHASAGGQIVAWAITGVGMWFIVNTFRVLTNTKPHMQDGLYAYARTGFGDFVGFLVAYGYWLCNCFSLVAYGVLIMSTLDIFMPGTFTNGNNIASTMAASLILWLMFIVASLGTKTGAIINVAGTICKMIPVFVFVVALAAVFKTGVFVRGFWGLSAQGTPLGFDVHRIGAQESDSMLVTLWLFIGMEGAVVVSGSARHPRDVSRATTAGYLTVLVLYILVSLLPLTLWLFIGMEGAVVVSGSARHPRDVSRATTAGYLTVLVLYILVSLLPLGVYSSNQVAQMPNPSMSVIMEQCFGQWGSIMVNAGVIISVVFAWLVWMIMISQMPLYAARDGIYPRSFRATNRFGAPSTGLVWTAITCQLLFVLCHFVNGDAWEVMISITSPRSFRATNRFGAPSTGLVWTAITCQLLFVLCHFVNGDAWEVMISITSVMAMPCYLLCCVYLWKVAVRERTVFRSAAARHRALATGILGTLFSLFLVYSAGYLLCCVYLWKVAVRERTVFRSAAARHRALATGILGTLFSLFLVYSAGLRYLMMACALYAIGLPLLVVARRQRRPGVPLRQLFSHRGWVVLSLIVVRYLMMACALYAIGLPLLVVARRQRRPGVPLRQLFSHRGWGVLSLIVVLGVCGLVYTVHGGVFGVA